RLRKLARKPRAPALVPTCHRVVSSNQIQQREQEDPNNVHEVPVEPADLQRRVILLVEPATRSHDRQHGQNADPNDHVQGVQPGHEKVKTEKHGYLLADRAPFRPYLKSESGDKVLHEVMAPFKCELDSKESRT